MSSTQLAKLTLTEIARRISRHLQRLEVRERSERDSAPKGEGAARTHPQFYSAGARRTGSRIRISYVSYQASFNLSRGEALHYLAALDSGFAGTHSVLFHTSPPPKSEEDEVRFTSLIRDGSTFFLYEVMRRTESRLYGRSLRPGWSPQFVDRSKVLKLRASEADLAEVQAAVAERDREIAAIRERFEERMERMKARCGVDSEGE